MENKSASNIGDFCSLVLAGGYGFNLIPLTSTYPKYLLCVGNYPLIYYSLRSLENAGFHDTLVVTRESWIEITQKVVETLDLKIKCEYCVLPEQYESNTAAVLSWIKPKLKCENVLILSGDVYGDLQLKEMASTYRKRNATLCMYAQACPTLQIFDPKGQSSKNRAITKLPDDPCNICEFLGYDPSNDKLLFCEYDIDISETISIPKYMYKKHQNFSILHKVIDLHLYIIKRSLIDFISPQSLLDYKSDLVTYLLSKQFSSENKPTTGDMYDLNDDVLPTAELKNKYKKIIQSCFAEEPIRCFVYLSTSKSLSLRVNNIPALFISNMTELQCINSKPNTKVLEPLNMKEEKNVVVGLKSIIERDASFQSSLVGQNCNIGKNCKIINSVIHNNVTIKDGSKIIYSIIGNDATIGTNCNLEECIVGNGETIEESSNLNKISVPPQNNN